MTVDAATAELLRGSLASMFGDRPHDLATALDELGWADVVDADTELAQDLLMAEHARALSTAPALDAVAAAALGLAASTRFVWPYFGASSRGLPSPCSGLVEVRGLLLGDIPDAAMVPGGGGVFSCDLASLEVRPIGGVDPTAGWHLVSGTLRLSRPERDWALAELAATRGLASSLLALAESALEVAIAHVRSRHQFGQAVGSYQGVRHRLAGAYAALAGAQSLLTAATVEGGLPAARLAKAAAGRAHDRVAREAIQVCGAVGLSAEFPLAGFVRRGFLLDAFFASGRDIIRSFGQALADGADPVRVGKF
ncbi:acyl-CoA dehydrogenase family protein [Jatrophihabitans sp.]|uniref:acyl-CoA dehydrogenase family protein n=1 Tax=Jatrophihabitans sp. TaxID=1932789 RepID=UPI0030C66890|nr:putative Acyl-CoA dehydrogenase, short-chain specific [Jatrophihabitans sp.]